MQHGQAARLHISHTVCAYDELAAGALQHGGVVAEVRAAEAGGGGGGGKRLRGGEC